ncbi:MAG: O-antigen ligase family protein [Nitrospinota bacterium]|nr:O-antigen ligase family protein [Nitrospinota bacterium]
MKIFLANRGFYSKISFLCLMAYLFFAPFSISISQIFIFSGIISWFISFNREVKVTSLRFPCSLPIILFVVFTLSSAFTSKEPFESIISSRDIFQFLIFYFIINTINTQKEIPFLLNILLLSTSIVSLYVLTSTFLDPISLANRKSGFFSIYMTLGGFLVIVMSITITYLISNVSKGYRLWIFSALILMSVSILATLSRNAWVGLFISLILILLITRNRTLLIAFIGMLLVLLLISPDSVMKRIKSIGNFQDPTMIERTIMWKSAFKMILSNPFLGFGPGLVKKNYYKNIYVDPNLPTVIGSDGIKVNVLPDGVEIKKYRGHLHNNFLHLGVERGLPAMFSWLLLWVVFFFRATRNYLQKKESSLILSLSAIAGIVSLSGFLSSGMFEYNFGDSEVSMLMFFALSLPFLCRNQVIEKH